MTRNGMKRPPQQAATKNLRHASLKEWTIHSTYLQKEDLHPLYNAVDATGTFFADTLK